MLANQSKGHLSSEIKKIEESFGGTQHLMKKLTLIELDKKNPYDGEDFGGE